MVMRSVLTKCFFFGCLKQTKLNRYSRNLINTVTKLRNGVKKQIKRQKMPKMYLQLYLGHDRVALINYGNETNKNPLEGEKPWLKSY